MTENPRLFFCGARDPLPTDTRPGDVIIDEPRNLGVLVGGSTKWWNHSIAVDESKTGRPHANTVERWRCIRDLNPESRAKVERMIVLTLDVDNPAIAHFFARWPPCDADVPLSTVACAADLLKPLRLGFDLQPLERGRKTPLVHYADAGYAEYRLTPHRIREHYNQICSQYSVVRDQHEMHIVLRPWGCREWSEITGEIREEACRIDPLLKKSIQGYYNRGLRPPGNAFAYAVSSNLVSAFRTGARSVLDQEKFAGVTSAVVTLERGVTTERDPVRGLFEPRFGRYEWQWLQFELRGIVVALHTVLSSYVLNMLLEFLPGYRDYTEFHRHRAIERIVASIKAVVARRSSVKRLRSAQTPND